LNRIKIQRHQRKTGALQTPVYLKFMVILMG